MREHLEARLKDLEHEFAAGAQKLREAEAEQARLRDAMLRIDGALQVLREMLAPLPADGQEVPPRAAAADPARREAVVLTS